MSGQQQAAAQAVATQEGARWRYAKPSADEVAAWFLTVPLDEGMDHSNYVSGVVIIKASEKVKKAKADGRGHEEVWEDTYTPYVRVDTRISYFRNLAAKMEVIAVIEPIEVPKVSEGAFKNDNMPEGFWWHIAGESNSAVRSLCCTMRVALYGAEDWFTENPHPLREGRATKQVTGAPDPNGLAKAETGAIGRALGMAGILVVGTGVATAEDMQEFQREQPQQAALPEAGSGTESEEALNVRLIDLQAQLRPREDGWREFAAWWTERSQAGGWRTVMDAPVEVRRGMATKMQGLIDSNPVTQIESATPQDDSSPPGPATLPAGAEEAAAHEVA